MANHKEEIHYGTNSIKKFLTRNKISYSVSEHKPVFTSKQAAEVRQSELKTGVKALILKSEKGVFIMGLVAADRRLDLKKLAKIVATKKIQLASPEEVLDVTGCEVGSVPPFGNLFGLSTFANRSLVGKGKVIISSGDNDVSFKITGSLLKKIVPGLVISSFTKSRKA